MPKRIEMPLPVPTKSLLNTSPDVAMLFAPFGLVRLKTAPRGNFSHA